MRISSRLAFVVTLLGSILTAGAALAQPRPNVFDGGNQWRITGYFDNSIVHQQAATQCVCFLPYAASGTQVQGAWYSCSFPNWRGRYAQEGDRVLMHAEFGGGAGHDGMVIELFAGTSPSDEGAGQWTEWLEGGAFGTTIAFGNCRLRRAGRCPLPANVDLSKLSRAEIDKLAVDLSNKVKPRLRTDGKPAQSPLDPAQVPLPEHK
jgi:hypothetical protein